MAASYKVLVRGQIVSHVHIRWRCGTTDDEPSQNSPSRSSSCTREASMIDLANKTALVTGASRGMGRAAALALAAAGARVIVHYGRGVDEAQAVVAQIRANGGRADAIAADLAAPDGAHTLAAKVRALVGARLDIIVA